MNEEGIKTFYKGLNSALIGTVLSYGIYFWWYRLFKNFFYQVLKRKELSDLDITIITFISGAINSFLTSPIWFINTRMATGKGKGTIWETIKDIYKTEGLQAFYKGVIPNLILVINPIINFVIYEAFKKFMLKNNYSMNAG